MISDKFAARRQAKHETIETQYHEKGGKVSTAGIGL
jgi:hypothetical protein